MMELLTVYKPSILVAHTIEERNEHGTPRMRLLGDQYLETLNGEIEECDDKLNVQCETKIRHEHPIGTQFKVAILEKHRAANGEVFYTTAGYCPVQPL